MKGNFMDVNSDKSNDSRKKELKLLKLARQHRNNEEEIITRLREENITGVVGLIIENSELVPCLINSVPDNGKIIV